MSASQTSSEKRSGLLRSSAVVSSMTMLSRVLGLARDILFAKFIGAGGDADAFYVAFKIPNFLRRLFAEGAFAQAFVPVLCEYKERGSQAAVQHFLDRIAGCLGISLIGIVSLVVLASPIVTAIFGAGFLMRGESEKFWLTADLVKVTFPYLFLISMTGFAGAILNSYNRFAVPALTPIVLNLVLIVAAACIAPRLDTPVYALAWGVFIAGALQLVLQLPFLIRLGLLPRPKVDWQDKAVKKVLTLMAPAMFGVSISQINLTLDTVLASFLVDGSITWLYFSDRLVELPLGVFGVGIATVILPNLSRKHVADDTQFGETVFWALKMVMLIGLPASVALVVIAEPLLFTLFQYDKMTVHDIAMSAMSLRAYATGLCAFMLVKVLASAYFSRQDTRTPVKVGVIAMVANMVFNLMFALPLLFLWNIGHVGLAIATACSSYLNVALLFLGLRRDGVFAAAQVGLRFWFQLIVATLTMALTLSVVLHMQSDYELQDWLARCQQLAVLVLSGACSFVLVLVVSGMRFRDIKHN